MHIHKKGVGVSSSAHPGTTGLRIALPTQDRQRSSAHASTDSIIIRYIETYHTQTSRCHLPAVGNGRVCEVRSPQRQTFENVFLNVYDRPLYPWGLTSDGAKIQINLEFANILEEKNASGLHSGSKWATFPRVSTPLTLPTCRQDVSDV